MTLSSGVLSKIESKAKSQALNLGLETQSPTAQNLRILGTGRGAHRACGAQLIHMSALTSETRGVAQGSV